ncbi:MAG: cation:proton antiporter [Coraliomargaritaceae bacterium]
MLPIAALSSQNALWALCFAVGAGGLLTVLSRKCQLPTIVFLLLAGFTFGPEGLGIIDPNALGEQLTLIVSLAIGLILFEGGLTLDFKGFTQTSPVIKRLLTVGVLTTWLGVSMTVFLVFKTSGSFALLMGSLVIVTGPTVIVPMLRRIRTHQRICSILHWEGVLIDSIGVFIAILCFEWAVEGGGSVALPNFILRIVSGIGLGTLGGYGIYWMLSRGWVPSKNVNAFSLASALLIFGTTELIKPEAGLLAVTLAGLVVGIKKPAQLREVKAFKAEIVDLLIGMLFLLLVSRLELNQFKNFFEQGGIWVLLSVLLLVRPLSILISARGTSLNWREKTLLSWVAPRGVVAASMASLFALSLGQQENPVGDPELMESFVYSVICATVLLQGLSAGLFARLLGLQRPAPNDWLFIGAHHLGRKLAHTLIQKHDQSVILVDTNARNIQLAREEGLLALQHNGIQAEELYDDEEALYGIGYVLALTDNVELNQLIMLRWSEVIDRDRVHGWIPRHHPSKEEQVPGQAVFRDLPRPAIAGIQLNTEESKLAYLEAQPEAPSKIEGDCPLFLIRGKQVRALSGMEAIEDNTRPDDQILAYEKNATR